MWPEVKALLERLIVAEQMGSQVNRDLGNLLTQLAVAAKDTFPTTESSSSVAGRFVFSVGHVSA